MPLDFPSNPTNGQVYDTYVYDSSIASWRSQGSTNNLGTQIAALQAKRGKILQVVYGTTTTQVNISSTSKVSTGLTATITPLYADSSIVVLFNTTTYAPGGQRADYGIFRNGIEQAIGTSINVNSSSNVIPLAVTHVDYPATTSAVTYNLRASTTSGTIEVNWAGYRAGMVLMEVAS